MFVAPLPHRQPLLSSPSSPAEVAYISGICLLVVVAVCLIVAACMLRRKDRRLAAGQRAEQEAQLAAAQQAAAAEAARRAANPPVIPVVIVQPDGVLELAEEVKIKAPWGGSSGGDPGGPGTGHPKAVPPIGFHVAQ